MASSGRSPGLRARASIARLGSGTAEPENLGLLLYGDQALALSGAAEELPEPAGASTGLRDEPIKTKEWLAAVRKAGGVLDYREASRAAGGELETFTTRLLVNLERSKDAVRKTAAGEWNDVVPYAAHQAHYGRNFVICTGRQGVLVPIDSGNFDGNKHFARYRNVSPTE